MNDETWLFAEAPVSRAVITLAVPTVISQLITVVYNMADTFFIGQMGDASQVAAATLAMPCFMLLTGFANLFGIGGASLISRSLGAGDRARANAASAFCIRSALLCSLLYGIAVIALEPLLFPLLGADAETWGYLEDYMLWTVGIGALPTVANSLLAHLVRAEGHSAAAGVGLTLGGILNIVLDPIFIFTLGLEVEGAAIATMLSNLTATVYFVLFLLHRHGNTVIRLHTARVPNSGIAAEVIGVGLPAFVMTMMSTLSNATLNHMVAGYSSTAIAGMGIAKRIDLLAYAIAQGMTQGTLPLIGYNYSSKDYDRMRRCIKTLFKYALAVAACGTVLMLLSAKPLVACFISDSETVEHGRRFLKIICLACPTTALNFAIITVLQAVGEKKSTLLLSLLRKGSLDIVFMLIFNSLVGISGIAWATPAADALALIVALAIFVPYMKHKVP